MSRLLLDTHSLLWWLSDVPKLAEGARAAIANPGNDVFVSAVSGWEISAKRAKGRITAPENLAALIEEEGFTHLPLSLPRRTGGMSPATPSRPDRPDACRPGPGRETDHRDQRRVHPALWRPNDGRVTCGRKEPGQSPIDTHPTPSPGPVHQLQVIRASSTYFQLVGH